MSALADHPRWETSELAMPQLRADRVIGDADADAGAERRGGGGELEVEGRRETGEEETGRKSSAGQAPRRWSC